MGVFDDINSKRKALTRRLRDRMMVDLAAVLKDTISLTPINGMAGIEVVMPETVDLIALTEESRRQLEAMEVSERRNREKPVSPIGLGIYMAHEEAQNTDHIDFSGSLRSLIFPDSTPRHDSEDTQMSQNLGNQQVLRTPSPLQLVCEHVQEASSGFSSPHDGFPPSDDMKITEHEPVLRTPNPAHWFSNRGGEGSDGPLNPTDWATDDGAHTPPSPEDGHYPPTCGFQPEIRTEEEYALPEPDNECGTEANGIRESLGQVESPVLGGHRLSFIEEKEEDDDVERTSLQTVIRRLPGNEMSATELLISMANENLSARDIPGFITTTAWADNTDKDTVCEEEQFQKTLTPGMFRGAEASKSRVSHCIRSLRRQQSIECLRSLFVGNFGQAPEDVANIFNRQEEHDEMKENSRTSPLVKREAKNVLSTAHMNDRRWMMLDIDGGLPISHDDLPQSLQTEQTEECHGVRGPSGNTTNGSDETSTSQAKSGNAVSTPNSSFVGYFPRRRCDQTPAISSHSRVFSNPGRRRVTFPLGTHHIGLRE